MNAILYTVFFLSGAAALLFETLLFRQAGLTFGNSVWASSLVLSSFMAGLALGNGLVARHGARIRRPVRGYAALELAIAISGVTLVGTLPALGGWLTPLLRPFLEWPWILNPLRMTLAFLLLLVPATAMGATLPVMVKALLARDPSFGSVLGRLYGWNTLGAVVGSVAGETVLIGWVGVRGTAALAGGLDLAAAAVALVLAGRVAPNATAVATRSGGSGRLSARTGRFLIAAFLSGGTLLALEVVWFRFLRLFVHGGGLAFALMLATVLAGIGLGGLAAGLWTRRNPEAYRHVAALALGAGCLSVLVYAGFRAAVAPFGTGYVRDPGEILWLTFVLTFPVSFLSGMLFTGVGAALSREVRPETRAAGLLTLWNTVGAGLGAFIAGFVLLPIAGMELSFFVLAGVYGIVGSVLWSAWPAEAPARGRWAGYTVGALFILALLLFPFGRMESDYLELPVRRYAENSGARLVASREGLTETILLLRRDIDGEPVSHRLLTDGFSMSGTEERNRRYMKLFVYLPVALHPRPERALLISYGVGSTARALLDTPGIERVDVVDISREILETSDLLYHDHANPLRDPRVRVYVEDGRYFLQSTENRYDLITGEPPPPKIAGVVNLYTREYFELIHDRLAEGGVNTYWLPVHNLTESDTAAIVRAYCDVFEDCSLWAGSGLDWILAGSRGWSAPPSVAGFIRQWEDPAVGAELRALGIERPEQLGALFIADADNLRETTRETAPLVDDFPKRLSNALVDGSELHRIYSPWMDTDIARKRFRESDFIDRAWPEALREATLAQFDYQRMINESETTGWSAERLDDLHVVLTGTELRTLPLWLLGARGDELGAVRGVLARGGASRGHEARLAFDALAGRQYGVAADYLEAALEIRPRGRKLLELRVYALCMAGRLDEAADAIRDASGWLPRDGRQRWYREWMNQTFALEWP